MKEQFTLSIRTILIVGFGGLVIMGIVASLYLGLSAAFRNTQELLTDSVESLVTRMADKIDARLRPAEEQALWLAERVYDGRLSLRDPETLDASNITSLFHAMLAATPQVGAVGVVRQDGVMYQWLRSGDDVLVKDWSSDGPFMEWVAAGREYPDPEWGPPFWLDSLETSVIVLQVPLFDDHGYFGYLTLAVTLTDLSRHLAGISDNAFVLVGQNDVLAHPLMIDWRPLDQAAIPAVSAIYEGQSALVPITEIGDAVLEHIWSAEYQDLTMLENMTNTHAVATELGDRQYVFLYRTIDRYGPVPWNVGTYINITTASDVIERLDWAIVAGFGVFIIVVVLGLFLARAIVLPIRALARASEAVQKNQLHDVPVLPTSRITELDRALSSFGEMVAGLVERELIRRTLGRYVPEAIAEKLLADGGGLPPTEGEATILFTDIAGFTALTEALGPSRIVEVLNAYFSRMTAIIEAKDGVITQFQGDAILAIFNVPIENPDHAERACHAALAMRSAVETEVFAGQKLSCRIGINTGQVIAGAVGAEDRLTYTVHGDAVNRAARVEAMNKEAGTTILLTETTACLVKAISTRKISTMTVRGQTTPVTIYTIDR